MGENNGFSAGVKGGQTPPRELFLRDWEASVIPIEKQASDAYTAAVGYSLLVLKSILILNGGALAVLPAIVSTFGTAAQKTVVVSVAICFVAGVVFAVAAIALSYFTAYAEGQCQWYRREMVAHGAIHAYYKTSGCEEKIVVSNKQREKLWEKSNKMRIFAIICVLISVSTFLAGALLLLNSVL